MTVARPTIKVNKWAVVQFQKIPTSSPKQQEYSSHSLTYEITHPYKNGKGPYPGAALAERSYPLPKVRGGDRERQAATAQERPRGATPRPRSGAAAKRTYSYPRSGQRPRRATPCPRSVAVAEGGYPTSEVRSGGRGELPHVRGRGGGRDKLPHFRGQGQQRRGAIPGQRSGGCAGAGGLRGITPRSRSGGAAVRRYPSSKIRSSGCALLEQPGRDTPRPR